MKRFLFSCLTILLASATWAAEGAVLCFAVVEKNGEETYFALSEKPTITYDSGAITVSVPEYSIEGLALADIDSHYYTQAVPVAVGIGNIPKVDDSSAEFVGGKAFVTGLKAGAQVYVYTADGQTIGSLTAGNDGVVCVDFGGLKSGQVYILRTPSTSYKIAK